MKVQLLKNIDSVLGNLLIICINKATLVESFKLNRLLVIRPGGIGDALLLAPVFKRIKSSFPYIDITVLAERRNREVFTLVPEVDKVFCYDIPSDFMRVLTGRYDAVIDTEQWYRLSAVVARVIRAPMKIGFGSNERSRMFTHFIEYDQSAYELVNFTSLLKPLGIDKRNNETTDALVVPTPAVAKADLLLAPMGSKPYVVIFPGASLKEKCWEVFKFRQVAEFLSEAGYSIVVVGGSSERLVGEFISNGLGLNLAAATTLPETAAIVARSKLLVSADSGVLHISALLGIPTLSLFGPSFTKKWVPRGDKHIALSANLPCSPCSKFGTIPPCPYDVRCMKEITAAQVVAAAVKLLNKTDQTTD